MSFTIINEKNISVELIESLYSSSKEDINKNIKDISLDKYKNIFTKEIKKFPVSFLIKKSDAPIALLLGSKLKTKYAHLTLSLHNDYNDSKDWVYEKEYWDILEAGCKDIGAIGWSSEVLEDSPMHNVLKVVSKFLKNYTETKHNEYINIKVTF